MNSKISIAVLTLAVFVCLTSTTSRLMAATARESLHSSYRMLVEADAALRAGDSGEKVVLTYRAVIANLETLQRQYPGWQQGIVAARLAHARNRLALLENGHEAPATAIPGHLSGEAEADSSDSVRSRIDAELSWRKEMAQAHELVRSLRRENFDLRNRVRALERMPSSHVSGEISRSDRETLTRVLSMEAERLQSDNQNPAALELLEIARSLLPDDPDVALASAVAFCHAGRFEQATGILRPLAAAQPDNAIVRLALGTAWMGLGKLGLARAEIESSLQADPDNPDAYYNMAQLLLLLPDGDPFSARQYYMQSVALGGEPDPEIEKLIQRTALRRIDRRR